MKRSLAAPAGSKHAELCWLWSEVHRNRYVFHAGRRLVDPDLPAGDFLQRKKGFLQKFQPIRLLRITTLVVLFLASLLVFTGLDSALLKWSYMSMGLRGSAVFAGLFVLVFMKKYCHSRIILVLLYMLPVAYIIMNVIWWGGKDNRRLLWNESPKQLKKRCGNINSQGRQTILSAVKIVWQSYFFSCRCELLVKRFRQFVQKGYINAMTKFYGVISLRLPRRCPLN